MSRTTKITVTMAIIVIVAAVSAVAEVQWASGSYADIFAKAKQDGKFVFIDFYTTWCGPCKKLDKVTYTDAGVEEFLRDAVSVKIDSEKGEGIDVSAEYRVIHWPTMVLVGTDGVEIDRHVGYLDPDEFLEKMTNYKNGIGTIAFYEEKLEQQPRNRQVMRTLAEKYFDAGRFEESLDAAYKYVSKHSHAADDDDAEVFYLIAQAHHYRGEYEDAVRTYQGMIGEFSDTWKDQAYVGMARAYFEMGEKDKCIEQYMKYVSRHEDEPKALNSFAWYCAQRKFGFDEALPVALKMVELTSRDPGYLDTLAELYYAMGEYDKAIEVGKEAQKKEPSDVYFKDQVEKFEKAKVEAEGQASK